ncbi:MAG: hypothetical protein ACR2H7_11015 [Actinomycetota bacterium]
MVIGALAALLQGVPLPRNADIDVTPASDVENKKRLARALRDLEAKLRTPGLDEPIEITLDERTFAGMVTMTFTTTFGSLDICFVPDGTEGYEDLKLNALTVTRFGVKIPVASVADITRSKRAAGREKDAAHLLNFWPFWMRSESHPNDDPDAGDDPVTSPESSDRCSGTMPAWGPAQPSRAGPLLRDALAVTSSTRSSRSSW